MKEGLTCYAVKVNTTNSSRDTFKIEENYFPCEDGMVYVLAKDMTDAASQVPSAREIRRVGLALAEFAEEVDTSDGKKSQHLLLG